MTNYYYIVASLPAISQDWKFGDNSADVIIQEIRERSTKKDLALIDRVVKGFDDAALNPEFYQEVLGGKNEFLKEYYAFDLNVRNAKVRYLNKALDRRADRDVIDLPVPEFEQAAQVEDILASKDILERERSLDDLYWKKLSALSEQHYFDMNVILAFILKLHIIDRWHSLDEQTGRKMFKTLVDEVRGTFKGVEYDAAAAPVVK